MTVYCGVDLGTSFCCAYFLQNGSLKPLTMADGAHIFPSVVDFRADGSVVIGRAALRAGDIAEGRVVMNWKRFFGKTYTEDYKKRVELSCKASVINYNGKYAFSIPSRENPVTPEMVCAEILKWIHEKMLVIAEGEAIEYCITLPAAYNIQQKLAMRTVVDLAGIKCPVKFITEPVAAAISYSIEKMMDKGYILVYDLGGGTFDASILRIDNRHFKVLNWQGDIDIGGEQFNMDILNWVNRRFHEDLGEHILPDTNNERKDARFIRAQRLLLETCCEAKIHLSSQTLAYIDIGDYFKKLYKKKKIGNQPYGTAAEQTDADDDAIDEEEMIYELTRVTFNTLIQGQINSTIHTVNLCLSTMDMSIKDIDNLVMVGGSSQIPIVYETLCKEYGEDKISKSINCSECVAAGATRFIASKDIMDITITECATRDVFISTRPNLYKCIIKSGSELPAEGQYSYYMNEDNIGYATAMIYESSADGKSYEPVGELVIDDDSLLGRKVDLIYKFRLEDDFTLTTSFSEGANVLDEKEIQLL